MENLIKLTIFMGFELYFSAKKKALSEKGNCGRWHTHAELSELTFSYPYVIISKSISIYVLLSEIPLWGRKNYKKPTLFFCALSGSLSEEISKGATLLLPLNVATVRSTVEIMKLYCIKVI